MRTIHRTWCLSALALIVVLTGTSSVSATEHSIFVPAIGTDSAGKSDLGTLLFRGGWGDEPGRFGKVDEASRPGPMDFSLVGERLFVLDPVNSRVQVFDIGGAHQLSIGIGTQTADFLAIDSSGAIVVMDAFVKRELIKFSDSGARIGRVLLPSDLTLPSAVFVRENRLWVEQRHDQVVELSAPAKSNDSRTAEVLGLESGRRIGTGNGQFHASKRGDFDVVLRSQEETSKQQTTVLKFPRRVTSVEALEGDASGRVYLAASCQRAKRSSWETDLVVVVLDKNGELAGTVAMPNQYVTDHYRKLFVAADGRIIQMQTSEEGVSFFSWVVSSEGSEQS